MLLKTKTVNYIESSWRKNNGIQGKMQTCFHFFPERDQEMVTSPLSFFSIMDKIFFATSGSSTSRSLIVIKCLCSYYYLCCRCLFQLSKFTLNKAGVELQLQSCFRLKYFQFFRKSLFSSSFLKLLHLPTYYRYFSLIITLYVASRLSFLFFFKYFIIQLNAVA